MSKKIIIRKNKNIMKDTQQQKQPILPPDFTPPSAPQNLDNANSKKHKVQSETENLEKTEKKDLEKWTEEPFKIIESYFEGQHLDRLVRHQIESYNHFCNYQLQRTIQMFNPIVSHSENDFNIETGKYDFEIMINLNNFKLYPPQIHENNGATKLMFPQEARLRNFTYASNMTVDVNITYTIRDKGLDVAAASAASPPPVKTVSKTLSKINIGKLPIMLKSSICLLTQNKNMDYTQTGECKYDCGGYFIINGTEKTVLAQERAAENRVYCFCGKNTTKWCWYAEIKSVPDFKCISPKQIEVMIANKNNGFGHSIFVNIPRIKTPIELFVIFRALGVVSDKSICEHILLNIENSRQKELLDALYASIIDANKYMTQEDAIQHITSHVAYVPMNMDKEMGAMKKREFTMEVLANDLFPHCQTAKQKIYFLGYMTNMLLQTSLGLIPPDDRDSYVNKRIELTGTLINNLFRNYLNKLVKEMQKQIVREINNSTHRDTEDYENIINHVNIHKIIKPTTIENGIKRALSTGDFSIKQSNTSKVGVAQVLNRLTYAASLSHLRRVNTPMDKSGELIAPRKLHNTTWGYLCLSGDTEILMANRMDTRKIRDLKDGDWVTTINRTTLEEEPSPIHSWFCKMPDKLLEITTISGRKIKVTPEHPLLVAREDNLYEMVNSENLRPGDKLVVRHTAKYIADENTTKVVIRAEDVLEYYRMDLLELNLLNKEIPTRYLKIIARLIGALNNDGNIIIEHSKNGREYYKSSFNLGEELDVYQVNDDIQKLGFGSPDIKRSITKIEDKNTGRVMTYRTWNVSKHGAFSYLLYLLGGKCGKKTNKQRSLPEWLVNAELSIKREFLSGFIGGDGCKLSYHFTSLLLGGAAREVKYMTQISDMFKEFDINCKIVTNNVGEKSQVIIVFENTSENMLRYADVINYTYCEEKRRKSAIAVEKLKIKHYNKSIIDDFTDKNILSNGAIGVPILSIAEIEPEPVYDFTTFSENHSFVAANIVSSNCVSETPEGQSIGLVKNFSYMAHITIPSNSAPLYEYVEPYLEKVDDIAPTKLYGFTKVFVNGSWLGITRRPMELYEDMKHKKRHGIINIYTSVVFNYKYMEIRICNDGGRLSRPVLRVKDNRLLITPEIIDKIDKRELLWNDLLCGGLKMEESIIEYIDPEEQGWSIIAMKPHELNMALEYEDQVRKKFTHCEIHPSTIFGVLASCIPFPEYNQAPRNAYQSCMSKQSIGIYATNYDQRMDKTSYILSYPTRPLVDTRIMDFIKLNEIPSGTQAIVAIMTHTGYNQEDSILINQGSIDRGMFMATIYHTEKDENGKKLNGEEHVRRKPDFTKTKGKKIGNYEKVNNQGFIPENTFVENRDIIIAKVLPIKENRNDPAKTMKYEDQSKVFKTTEQTYIDKNYMGRNGDGYNFAKVRTRTLRKPEIGDKFASRSAQKGTIGNIIPEADMPFTKSGLRPDIIINPHCIPSRMTLAQLKETLLCKVLMELGMFGDGTAFGDLDIKEHICKIVQDAGFESYGNEVMYSGLTGEQLESNIFIGPCFYQRLKHMVNDKVHSRATGPMVILNRQPTEGRSKNGGLRLGEMEQNCLTSGGYSAFLRERFYDASDKFSSYVCRKCGLIAAYNDKYNIHLCNTCENKSDFSYVEIPYAFKLMSQELQTINVSMRLITE